MRLNNGVDICAKAMKNEQAQKQGKKCITGLNEAEQTLTAQRNDMLKKMADNRYKGKSINYDSDNYSKSGMNLGRISWGYSHPQGNMPESLQPMPQLDVFADATDRDGNFNTNNAIQEQRLPNRPSSTPTHSEPNPQPSPLKLDGFENETRWSDDEMISTTSKVEDERMDYGSSCSSPLQKLSPKGETTLDLPRSISMSSMESSLSQRTRTSTRLMNTPRQQPITPRTPRTSNRVNRTPAPTKSAKSELARLRTQSRKRIPSDDSTSSKNHPIKNLLVTVNEKTIHDAERRLVDIIGGRDEEYNEPRVTELLNYNLVSKKDVDQAKFKWRNMKISQGISWESQWIKPKMVLRL